MKKLKPCAISSIFKGQPSYLSTPLSAKRPTTSSSQSRLEKENLRIQRCEEELFKKETISDCHELSEKLKSAKLPSDFIIVKRDNFILFLNIDVSCETLLFSHLWKWKVIWPSKLRWEMLLFRAKISSSTSRSQKNYKDFWSPELVGRGEKHPMSAQLLIFLSRLWLIWFPIYCRCLKMKWS